MKLLPICLAVSVLFLQNVKSQDSLKPKLNGARHPVYTAMFYLLGGQTMKATLMAMNDSSVFIYQKSSAGRDPFHKVNIYAESQWESYNYKFIESVKVNNKKIRGWLIPTSIVAGIIGGTVIGKNSAHGSGWDGAYSAFGNIFLGAILGGALGTLTGLAVSSALDKKYMINGDWKSLEEIKASLKY
jgi:hypothetical protein